MIRDKIVDEVFRIVDLAYTNTLKKVSKDLDPPMTVEEMCLPLIRLQKKMDEYMLRDMLLFIIDDMATPKDTEPMKGFAHYR